MTEPSVELALAELTRKIDVGFTKTDGQLALLIQRTQAMERRADHQDAAIERLDIRMDQVEATRVTRADLDKSVADLRADAAEQRQADAEAARRSLMIWGLIVAVMGALLGAGVGVVGLFIR